MFTIEEINNNLDVKKLYKYIDSRKFSADIKEALKELAWIIIPDTNGGILLSLEDFQRVLGGKDFVFIGKGKSRGVKPALEALNKAIESTSLGHSSLQNISGCCLNFTVHSDFPCLELVEAVETIIYEKVYEEADVLWGLHIDDSLDRDVVKVEVLLAGFKGNRYRIGNNCEYRE